MRNILLIAQNILKLTFKKKGNILVYLVMPVVMTSIMMALSGSGSSKPLNIGIVDMDKSTLSQNLAEAVDKKDNFKTVEVLEDKTNDMVTEHQVDCVIKIPKNFGNDIYNGNNVDIELISIRGEDVTAWIGNFLNFYVGGLKDISKASEGKKEVFDKMYTGFKDQSIKLENEKLEDESLGKDLTQFSMGFLIMFVLYGTGITSNYILREKRMRTYFRICSAPVKSKDYIIGNIIANLTTVAAQVILVLLVITKIFKINTFIPHVQLFAVLLCFGLVAIGLGLVVVAFSKTSNQAGTANTLIVTPTCMLGGCFWPAEVMPQWLQRVGDFIPQTWALDSIKKLQSGSSFIDILPQLGILLAFAAAFFLIAVYKFNRRDDSRNFI